MLGNNRLCYVSLGEVRLVCVGLVWVGSVWVTSGQVRFSYGILG